VLGGSAQYVERLFRSDLLSLHENPQCLADRLATPERGVEVSGPAFLVLMGMGDRESEAGQRNQYGRLGPIVDTEGGGITGVKVECTKL